MIMIIFIILLFIIIIFCDDQCRSSLFIVNSLLSLELWEVIHVRLIALKLAGFIMTWIFDSYEDGFWYNLVTFVHFKTRVEVNWSLHFTMAEVEMKKID